MSEPPAPRRIPWLLIGAIVVGAALRLSQAGESLWIDELHTSWCISGSLGEVAERAAIGNQGPLYFWLVWFAASCLRYVEAIPPEIALRSLSLLAGCALPGAMYWLTTRFLSHAQRRQVDAPLLAAWLTALDPLGVYYAQEARPYALLQLLAVLHIGALLELFRSRNWQQHAWWIISGALLVHLHFTAGLVLVAEAVAVVIYLVHYTRGANQTTRTDQRKYATQYSRQFAIDFVILGVLLLPALPLMMDVGARRANWKSFIEVQPAYEILRLFPWTICILFLAFVQWREHPFKQRHFIVLGAWLLVPQIVAWIATVTNAAPLFYSRYLLASWPASLLTAALVPLLIPRPGRRVVLTMGILVGHILMGGMWHNWHEDRRLLHDRNEDWRTAIATLDPSVTSNDRFAPVLVRSGLIEADSLRADDDPLLREYCLLPVRGMYRVGKHHSDVFYPLPTTDPGKLLPDVRDALLRADEALLLVRSSRDAATMAQVRERLVADLQASLGEGVRVEAEVPETIGSIYLQRLLLCRPANETHEPQAK